MQGFYEDEEADSGIWYYQLFFVDVEGALECVGIELRSFAWQGERSYTTNGEHAGSALALNPPRPRYVYSEEDHEQFLMAEGSSGDRVPEFPAEIPRGRRMRDRMSPAALTTGLLRDLKFGSLVGGALLARETGHLAALDLHHGAGEDLEKRLADRSAERKVDLEKRVSQVRDAQAARVGRGGRPLVYQPDFYRIVAEVYMDARDRAKPVIEAVSTSDRLRNPMDPSEPATPVSAATAKKWIGKAREHGFISAVPKRAIRIRKGTERESKRTHLPTLHRVRENCG